MSLTEVSPPSAAAETSPASSAEPAAQKAAGSSAAGPQVEQWLINSIFVTVVHVVGVLALIFYRPTWQTLVLTAVVFNLGEMGITMGYHRLWSHRAYTASLPLRVFLAICGTLGFQASIKWWVLRHRLHHRYTDTDHDPYDSTKGLLFSHIGWIFQKPHYPRMKSIDISDLRADPVVRFQHKYYLQLAMILGFALPTVLAAAWGDALGGFLWGGFVARLGIWHCTFMINSFAHWGGEMPFARGVSAKGGLLLAFMTWGEGYHNFHHEFPKDYRNGVRTWDWDPTKWGIYLLSHVGLASELYRAPTNEIQKAIISVKEAELLERRKRYDWGPEREALPAMTRDQLARLVREDPEARQWVLIDGYVLDTKAYASSHPGGHKVFQSFRGKDASAAFNGGMNAHTASARSMAKMLRVARIADDDKEE